MTFAEIALRRNLFWGLLRCETEISSHPVEVPEPAGSEEHEGEEKEVITGVDDDAGGQGTRGKSRPAENEADTDEQKKRAERVAGLIGVQKCEENAGDNRGNHHSGDGPLRVTVLVERMARLACGLLGGPIEGGAEGGEKEAAEAHFFKERRERHAKAKQHPGGAGNAEDLVDRCVCGAGQEQAVEDGEGEAGDRCSHEVAASLESRMTAPLQAIEESLAPDHGEDDERTAQGEEVEQPFGAEGVVDFGCRLREGCHAEKAEVDTHARKQACAEQTAQSDEAQDADVSQVGNPFQ